MTPRYRLDALLGAGGMGIVYRGSDTTIERVVAIKVLASAAAALPSERSRFLREMKAIATVTNPHCVTLFDVGESENGEAFLVMNLIEGQSLAATIEREGRLPLERAISIGKQVCEALAAAHNAGIVHRDVKPGNIMLTPRGDRDFVTVLDFGLAKGVGQGKELTSDDVVPGTLQYVAPEQIVCDRIDGRADQYSLAATLMRAITGEPLFACTGAAALVHHQLHIAPKTLEERLPGVSTEVSAVLSRALEKSPDARFSDIETFASALQGNAPRNRASRLPLSERSSLARDIELQVGADDIPLELDVRATESRSPRGPASALRGVSLDYRRSAPLQPFGEQSEHARIGDRELRLLIMLEMLCVVTLALIRVGIVCPTPQVFMGLVGITAVGFLALVGTAIKSRSRR
jgi:serine/threonine protein kinase